ncbi:MAG TPA: hypothetical protein VM100_05880 [Longimicrobiales bacterium]|nr:hypothetical protein [Longimicrobiales bacterium]
MKIKILKKDGSPTPYFWSDKHSGDRHFQTVFKHTTDGIKKMKGVYFDAIKNKLVKHSS